MSPSGLTIRNNAGGRNSAHPVPMRLELNNPSNLSSASNRVEAQDVIREGIRRGVVRVVPIPGCPTHVRVVRVGSFASR